MTILEEARGQAPIAPVDPKGVAYGIDRTGNVPHVKTVDGSIVETGDDSVVTTLTGSVTKTETGSLTKTETGSKTTTETGSVTKTETGSLTKTEQGSLMTIVNDTGVKANVTSTNRLQVESTIIGSPASIPINVRYSKLLTAVNANEWQEVAAYTVPTGYVFTVSAFRCYSATTGESARAYLEKLGGSYNSPTNVFTDGMALTLPQFACGIHLVVTSVIGGLNDTVTITYTNELGVTGRTCTIIVPKNSLVGTNIEGVLQGNDLGVIDITNVTHTATGQAGAFNLDLFVSIFDLLMNAANVQYQAVGITSDFLSFPAGSVITFAFFATTKTTYLRNFNLIGTLQLEESMGF